MKIRAYTGTFTDTSLYTPIIRLPFVQAAEFKVTLSTYTNDKMAVGTYQIGNTGMGFDVRLIAGDNIFDPRVIRNLDQKWTILAVTNRINSLVTAVLEYSNRDNYFRPLFNQQFKKLSELGGQDLTITKYAYQDYPSFSFGQNWADNKLSDTMAATNVVRTGNHVTVTINATRSNADIKWDDMILSGLPQPHLNSAGYYNTFIVKNNGHWFTLDTLLNNAGNLVVEDYTYSYQDGLDKTKPITLHGTFNYPVLSQEELLMVVYLLDENGFYKVKKQVADGYELGLHETTIAPDFTPTNRSNFDGTAWHDYSEAAYMHEVPAPTNEKRIIPEAPKPVANPGQKMIAQLALQQAQFQASQQELNSKLALQIAQMKVKEAN